MDCMTHIYVNPDTSRAHNVSLNTNLCIGDTVVVAYKLNEIGEPVDCNELMTIIATFTLEKNQQQKGMHIVAKSGTDLWIVTGAMVKTKLPPNTTTLLKLSVLLGHRKLKMPEELSKASLHQVLTPVYPFDVIRLEYKEPAKEIAEAE